MKQILPLLVLPLFLIQTKNHDSKIHITTSLEKLLQDAHISTKESIQKQGTYGALTTGSLLFLDSKQDSTTLYRSQNTFSLLFYTACAIGCIGIIKITFDYLNSLYAAKEAFYHFSNAKKELNEVRILVQELKEKNTVYAEKQHEMETILLKTQENAVKARQSMEQAEKNMQTLISKLSQDLQNVAYTTDVEILRVKINDLEDLLRQLSLSHLQQATQNDPDIHYLEQQIITLVKATEKFGRSTKGF